ncbi:MAG TPA: hypothetical protein DD490_20135 [Acidobacteria bacterium]|nr:hypothetical protein [Acidobacteriota bacterium]
MIAFLAVEQLRQPRLQRRWLRGALLVLAPVVLLGAFQLWIGSGSSGLRNLTTATSRDKLLAESGGSAGVYTVRATRDALKNFLLTDGVTFKTFWGRFGWLDAPLVIGSPATDEVVDFGLEIAGLTLLALLAVRLQQNATALVRIARAGRRLQALRLLVANPLCNSYLLFAAVLLILYVWTNNGFLAQGRNWFPVLPGLFWAMAFCAPRALASRRAGRWMSRAVLGALLLYAAVGGYWSIRVLEQRYYGPPAPPAGMVGSGATP